jgi:hypothetical protein
MALLRLMQLHRALHTYVPQSEAVRLLCSVSEGESVEIRRQVGSAGFLVSTVSPPAA